MWPDVPDSPRTLDLKLPGLVLQQPKTEICVDQPGAWFPICFILILRPWHIRRASDIELHIESQPFTEQWILQWKHAFIFFLENWSTQDHCKTLKNDIMLLLSSFVTLSKWDIKSVMLIAHSVVLMNLEKMLRWLFYVLYRVN